MDWRCWGYEAGNSAAAERVCVHSKSSSGEVVEWSSGQVVERLRLGATGVVGHGGWLAMLAMLAMRCACVCMHLDVGC